MPTTVIADLVSRLARGAVEPSRERDGLLSAAIERTASHRLHFKFADLA